MTTEIVAQPGSSSTASSTASPSSSSSSSFRKLNDMWHPHVYRHPPRSPTPFFIEDILRKPQQQGNGLSHTWRSTNGSDLYNQSVTTTSSELSSSASSSSELDLDAQNNSQNGAVAMEQPLNLTTSIRKNTPSDLVGHDHGSRAKEILKTLRGQKRKREQELPPPDTLSNLTSHVNDNGEQREQTQTRAGEQEVKKKKKVRTTFTGRQIFELEKMFENKKYLSSSERADMAKLLHVTEQQVKIWFQNRRTKWKKQENISNAEAAELMKAKSGKHDSVMSAINKSGKISNESTLDMSIRSSASSSSSPSVLSMNGSNSLDTSHYLNSGVSLLGPVKVIESHDSVDDFDEEEHNEDEVAESKQQVKIGQLRVRSASSLMNLDSSLESRSQCNEQTLDLSKDSKMQDNDDDDGDDEEEEQLVIDDNNDSVEENDQDHEANNNNESSSKGSSCRIESSTEEGKGQKIEEPKG